jgi:uncharacterized protein with von Willebrand factor type A (vWA) domain
MTVADALQQGLAQNSLMGFYQLCRLICIKSESTFDLYDQCFAAFFHNVEPVIAFNQELADWLENPIPMASLSEEQRREIKELDFDDLLRKFNERMAEQTERHDGGSKWIGTGGTSPFGHSGFHPSGIRMGGESRNRSAVQVASQRSFKNLRHDLVLDTRQIGLALSRLRRLSRDGQREELDLDRTIKKTGDNAGDISLVYRKEQRNSVKLLLLMDVGGSMTAHSRLSERLFSAAYASKHFRHFQHYYFHNCPYDVVYHDMNRMAGVATAQILRELDDSWYLIIVGDAAMSPHELLMRGGAVDWFQQNSEPGIYWLEELRQKFSKAIWLNPEPASHWGLQSTQIVLKSFSMFPLTIAGLEDGISHLRKR